MDPTSQVYEDPLAGKDSKLAAETAGQIPTLRTVFHGFDPSSESHRLWFCDCRIL